MNPTIKPRTPWLLNEEATSLLKNSMTCPESELKEFQYHELDSGNYTELKKRLMEM